MKRSALLAAAVAALSTLAACGDDPPAASPQGGSSTDMFSQCQAQGKLGDACACWRTFKPRFPNAPPGEAAFADVQLKACEGQQAKREDAGGKVVFPPRKVDDRDCYKGLKQTGTATEILADLANRCGAPTGMIKMTRVITGTQRDSDKAETYRIALRADECYRFFAIGDAGITNLLAQVRSPGDEIISGDNDKDRIKVLAPGAGICPKANGLYRVRVSVHEGGGQYILQGWRRPASATLVGGGDPKKTASIAAGGNLLGFAEPAKSDELRDLVHE